ncbi:MAG: NAD(P)/FAD-dependent oxidoreductase [Kiloniellales bacterium]|nr:NAD(P)/FAD-dependent oxidoreductase [Kiloniellales bacterium]
MPESYDSIVVGAGHNGLVCAAYLAKAGRRVLVIEAAEQAGGAAVTREFAPGYQVSACAHILHLLHPQVSRDLKLKKHGLKLAGKNLATIALGAGGEHLTLSGNKASGAISASDREAFAAWRKRMLKFAKHLQPLLASVPPRLGSGERADARRLARLGWAIRSLGRADMREFLRVGGMNVADLLEDTFESDLLRGALAFDAVLGTHFGPRSPGAVLSLLYRLAGKAEGTAGALALPEGGMGAVSRALLAAAQEAGAEIWLGTPVRRVLVENDRAVGVECGNGETVAALNVISNADPRRTFLELLGPEHLDTGFVTRVRNIRMRGDAAKVHLALDGLPDFAGLEASDLKGRLVIAPDVDYVERAFNPAKYGEFSPEPAMEITIPSLHDPSLAPAGKHVLSAVVQYAPYALKGGWEAGREAFARRVLEVLHRHAPDLESRIVASEVLTPADIERQFGMTGGHWHHGELALDQMLMLRPVPGAAQYATPLAGLYLCGAGTHPGGGVMGAAGRNAAGQVIEREAAA